MPLYHAYLMMGAISPDKTNLKLSSRDASLFRLAMKSKRATDAK
jgi:hypothetical protein